jgi:hypothetical protein
MREASDAMRAATNDLRRQDQNQAAASANRALERLRDLERQMQAGRPDERRRAAGEAQMEARQLADAQRQIASELNRTGGEAAGDSLRRMAGDQERLADRARRLQDTLKRQGGSGTEAAAELERQKLAGRMQQSAEALRNAADRGTGTQRGSGAPGARAGLEEAKRQQSTQQELARALDRLADRLGGSSDAKEKNGESGKLSEQIGRTQELQDRLNSLTNELKELARSSGRSTGSQGQGQSDRANQERAAGAGGSGDSARLRDEAQRALQETRELMEQLRRQDPTISRGGAGFTFEGQGLTATAPGTEAFKQDFAKWDDLRRQATQALEAAQTSLSKKLQAKEAKERLAAGAEDKAPPEYQKQVDDYFKAIAAKKKGG